MRIEQVEMISHLQQKLFSLIRKSTQKASEYIIRLYYTHVNIRFKWNIAHYKCKLLLLNRHLSIALGIEHDQFLTLDGKCCESLFAIANFIFFNRPCRFKTKIFHMSNARFMFINDLLMHVQCKIQCMSNACQDLLMHVQCMSNACHVINACPMHVKIY
jgi:hypothetical protein